MVSYITETELVHKMLEKFLNKFTIEALESLYDYYLEYEEDTKEQAEFDRIVIACSWDEYASINKYNNDNNESAKTLDDVRQIEGDTILVFGDNRFLVRR